MTVLASNILLNASRTLLDDDANVRWPLIELFDYLKDALRVLGGLRPAAIRSIQIADLDAGPLQAIDGVYEIISATRNVTSVAPTVYGRSPRLVELNVLDAVSRDWMIGAQSAVVENIAFDQIDKNRFWVYPPNNGSGKLELQVAVNPETLTYTGGGTTLANFNIALPIDDAYSAALTHYVLHRAWAKDADFAGNMERANNEFKLFTDLVKMNTVESPGDKS